MRVYPNVVALRDGSPLHIEGHWVKLSKQPIEVGSLYVAERNTGPELLIVKAIHHEEGFVVPTSNAYCYDMHECVPVEEDQDMVFFEKQRDESEKSGTALLFLAMQCVLHKVWSHENMVNFVKGYRKYYLSIFKMPEEADKNLLEWAKSFEDKMLYNSWESAINNLNN